MLSEQPEPGGGGPEDDVLDVGNLAAGAGESAGVLVIFDILLLLVDLDVLLLDLQFDLVKHVV